MATPPALSTKVSDDALRKATGRDWAGWVTRLDNAGAPGMTHAQIARHLSETDGVGDWWAQMITVGYEQAKGRRAKHQKPDGFSIGASKAIAAPIEDVYAAFTSARRRTKWLADADLTVRKATEFRSVRITWNGGIGFAGEAGTNIDVNLYDKSTATGPKTSAQIEHSKLPDAAAAERAKEWWKSRLDALKALLES